MRAIEFQSELRPDHTLNVPASVLERIPRGQLLRVLVLVPEDPEDQVWEQLAAAEFGMGYAGSDAIYEGGILRPLEPLALPEGETVEVTIAKANPGGSPPRAPTPEEEDYARRIKAAKSLEEMYAVMATAPPLPDGYDLCQALNANRKATGERIPFPELDDGSTP